MSRAYTVHAVPFIIWLCTGLAGRRKMEIEFVGFAADCRVEGKLDLADARLADLLNREWSIHLHHALVVGTEDGRRHSFDELDIARDELEAVVASGPSGDPKRRQSTTSDCVTMSLGPYRAEGFIHFSAAPRAAAESGGGQPMIALTDAILEYDQGSKRRSEWFRTLLVNRELAASIRMVASIGFQQETPA
jgi:hypothetical protein